MNLRWMIEEDPLFRELQRKRSTFSSSELKESPSRIKRYVNLPSFIGAELIGHTVKAKIINFEENEPLCLVNDTYKGYLSVASHLYHDLPRQIIKEMLQLLSKTESITCEVIGIHPDNYLRLKWTMD
jgi:hypothetical protein